MLKKFFTTLALVLPFIMLNAGCDSENSDIVSLLALKTAMDDGSVYYGQPLKSISVGVQPYQNDIAASWVQQDSENCGPTSFYMIFKYYNDHRKTSVFYDNTVSAPKAYNFNLDVAFLPIGSSFSTWLGVTASTTINRTTMSNKIAALRYESSSNSPYYSTYEKNLTQYAYNNTSAKTTIFTNIVNNFLKKGYPVIIHLRRLYTSGHFVIIVGYDESTNEVIYMDPWLKKYSYDGLAINYSPTDSTKGTPVQPLLRINLSNFLSTKWYKSESNPYLDVRAWWDGVWYGFYPDSSTQVTVPAAPSNLSATAASSSQINLSWADNSSNETGFQVERSADGTSYTQIATTTASSYASTGLTAATTYYYRVRAYNAAGSSAYTSVVSATTQAGATIPAAPSGLSASVASSSQINLSWADNSSNETGFQVERSADGTSYTQIATTTANSYSNTGLTAGATYYYRVRAYNAVGSSAYSNAVSATTTAAGTVVTATYTFSGVTVADAYNNAYENDVDQFPFGGNSANRNDHTEGTAAQYAAISASDNSRWATDDPDSYDEMMLWVEMLIEEDPAQISNISFTFEGYPSETGTVGIWVLKAGADWTADASWVQLGSKSISSGADGTLTCSITSNFANYKQSNGTIIWAVGAAEGHSDSLYIDYVKADVTYTE